MKYPCNIFYLSIALILCLISFSVSTTSLRDFSSNSETQVAAVTSSVSSGGCQITLSATVPTRIANALIPHTPEEPPQTAFSVNGEVSSNQFCRGDIKVLSTPSRGTISLKVGEKGQYKFGPSTSGVQLSGPSVWDKTLYKQVSITAIDACGYSNTVTVQTCSETNTDGYYNPVSYICPYAPYPHTAYLPSRVSSVTNPPDPFFQPLPACYAIKKKIITVGGMATPSFHPIFYFIEKISAGSVKIPLRIHSVGYNTIKLRSEINNQLSQKNKVLVVGHSLGSIIAFSISNEFAGRCVEFQYIDPPYNDPISRIPLLRLFPAMKLVKTAADAGIGRSPDSVIWTNGSGLLHFFTHDAFSFPFYRNNAKNLEALKGIISNRIVKNYTCSFDTVPSPISLKTAPILIYAVPPTGPSGAIRPGEKLIITGSGFSSVGNSVVLENSQYPDVYYEIFDLTPSGNTLSFIFPDHPVLPSSTTNDTSFSTKPGTYRLKVSAIDSDWSNAVSVEVKSGY